MFRRPSDESASKKYSALNELSSDDDAAFYEDTSDAESSAAGARPGDQDGAFPTMSSVQFQIPEVSSAEEEQERQLAMAWLEKRNDERRPTRVGSPQRASASSPPPSQSQSPPPSPTPSPTYSCGPIDLDTGKPLDLSDDAITVPTLDDVTSASYSGMSAMLSESTPMVGNASPERGMNGQLRNIPEEPILNDASSGQRPGFFNTRTTEGRAVIAFTVVLLLAIAVVVISVVLAGNNNDDSDNSTPTTSPTNGLRPTASPTRLSPPPTNPPVKTRIPTVKPTDAPSSSPQTQSPSFGPSALPTTQPTFAPTANISTIQFRNITINETALDLQPGANFGGSIALSANGLVMVVGAPNANINNVTNSGAAYVYERSSLNASKWTLRASFIGLNMEDNFGTAVAVNNVGSIIAISEPTIDTSGAQSGGVRVLEYNTDTGEYEPMAGSPLLGVGSIAYFGSALALSSSGHRLVVGAPFYSSNGLNLQGEVWSYEYSNQTKWVQMGQTLSGVGNLDWFGSSVDMSDDGSMIAIGAPRSSATAGYVTVWRWNETGWDRMGNVIKNTISPAQVDDRFGQCVSISQNNNGTIRLAVGVPKKDYEDLYDSGVALVFELNATSGEWQQIGAPFASGEEKAETGQSIKLLNASFLAIGVPGSNRAKGEVRLYRYQESNWEIFPENFTGVRFGDSFGVSVAAARPGPGSDLMVAAGALELINGGFGYAIAYQQV